MYICCLLIHSSPTKSSKKFLYSLGQGMFQSFFFICNYTGRTLGSWAVGWVAQEFGVDSLCLCLCLCVCVSAFVSVSASDPVPDSVGDCTLWTLATLNYAALWLSFGCNFPRFHPVRIARMNGTTTTKHVSV